MDEQDRDSLEEIDLRELFKVLLKWRWLIAGVTGAAVLVAAIMSFFVLRPVYESKMTLMVVRATGEERRPSMPEPEIESVVSPLASLPQRTIDTYIAQITSPALLKDVRAALEKNGDLPSVSGLAGLISARHLPGTNLVEVSVEHTDRLTARLIGEELIDRFLASMEEQDRTQLARSVNLLQGQLDDVKNQLADVRREYDVLRSRPRSARVVEAELELHMSLLSRTQDKLADNLTDVASTEAVIAELERQIEEASVPTFEMQTELGQQQAELARTEGQARALGGQISELNNQVASLQAELSRVESDERSVAAELGMLEETERLLREKMAETQILQAIDLAGVSVLVVSPADTPTSPIRPRKMFNMALAGMFGLLISVMAAFVLNTFDTTVRDQEDVEHLIGVPVIGYVPDFARTKGVGE